ncbi:MAG: FAD-dependent oxidoreductase, partial [Lachnospiraceae bacterium]|nr:FAD-dependent oxidoreductase [Lachnospiraceae bacterium]
TNVVKNMREKMVAAGCEVRFHSKVTNIVIENDQVLQLEINDKELIDVNQVVLAIGHSARDTFEMLYKQNVLLEAKSFAVGIRIEHPQDMINEAQYGEKELGSLPVASYKLTSQLESGRGVYSFCMCPGGFVINASSEEGKLAVNGMSYNERDGKNANSAIVVTVSPVDYDNNHPLAGIEFQRQLEEKAYAAGNGKIPVQCFGDFCDNIPSKSIGDVIPQIKGPYELTNIRSIFPENISVSIEEGIKKFDTKIKGFARRDSILSAIESRTSSPVRIVRDSQYESSVKGLYPCGEGAGYAGGITSAAMDGIKVAEAIAMDFMPFKS